jgi:hypothetical protein
VQLRVAGGQIVLEQKDRSAAGTYSTILWDAGEVLLDGHDLQVPAILAPGDYVVRVGLSNTANGSVLGETELVTLAVVQPN